MYEIFVLIAIQIPVLILAIYMAKSSRDSYLVTQKKTRSMFIQYCGNYGLTPEEAEKLTEKEMFIVIGKK